MHFRQLIHIHPHPQSIINNKIGLEGIRLLNLIFRRTLSLHWVATLIAHLLVGLHAAQLGDRPLQGLLIVPSPKLDSGRRSVYLQNKRLRREYITYSHDLILTYNIWWMHRVIIGHLYECGKQWCSLRLWHAMLNIRSKCIYHYNRSAHSPSFMLPWV